MARAKRREEMPLLEKQHSEQAIKDREFWEAEQDEKVIIKYYV